MERYNLVLHEKEGLHILTTRSYIRHVVENPGQPHDNWGDFYSDYRTDELSDVIHSEMDKDFLGLQMGEDWKIVSDNSFDPANADKDDGYLINLDFGVRVYAPVAHLDDYKPGEFYGWLSLTFIEKLFSENKKGYLQTDMDEVQIELDRILEKLK